MNKKEFMATLGAAIVVNSGIKVSIKMPDLEKNEIITNPAENVEAKWEYYDKAYDENLRLKTFDKIRIVDVELLSDKPSVKGINNQIDEISDKSLISDGSHTFEELYFHRMILFAAICNKNFSSAWKSKLHEDGTMFDNYFIVGISTPEGEYSYHYHMECWNYFSVKELDKAPAWDGHEPKDVIRLLSL